LIYRRPKHAKARFASVAPLIMTFGKWRANMNAAIRCGLSSGTNSGPSLGSASHRRVPGR